MSLKQEGDLKLLTLLEETHKILDKGELTLEGHFAQDLDVVNAARVSFHSQALHMSEREEGLINYLLRNHHGTPFEHGYFKFRVKAPLFVFREWHRHRIGHSYNEWSARYSQLEPEFYIPETVLAQEGKPGNYTYVDASPASAHVFRATLTSSSQDAYVKYEQAIMNGISKQQARAYLPVNIYSEMIWSCNPRSLMHFLGLRNHEAAQMEIREYAIAVERIFSEIMPVTAKAFIDGGRVAP